MINELAIKILFPSLLTLPNRKPTMTGVESRFEKMLGRGGVE